MTQPSVGRSGEPTLIPDRLLELLRCVICASRFTRNLVEGAGLTCTGCGSAVEIRGGVPRFVDDDDFRDSSGPASRTRASFGYEWTHFRDWQLSGTTNFDDYFDGLDLAWLKGRGVLDAGCGMGRHARHVAPFADTVVAMDFSVAIDQAARNVADQPNVHCIQADIMQPPLADDAFDFIYAIGVLHHLDDPQGALKGLTRRLKPGGRLRVYLYWKRSGIIGALLLAVSHVRRLTTRLPFGALRIFCWALSVVLYLAVIGPYKLLRRMGVAVGASWPLVVYSKYSFTILYNDQFDRFSAPIEKRYTESEVRSLLERVGLVDVQVFPRFGWVAEGVKPTLQQLPIQLRDVTLEAVQREP